MLTTPFDFSPRTSLVFGPGSVSRLPQLARDLGFKRILLVADPGMVAAGHVGRVMAILRDAGLAVSPFHDFGSNPDSRMVEAGRAIAEAATVDSIVALGGGSSLDCAKGVNFLLTNGGSMRDYWGFGKATQPMLPSIGIPTTAGTGSEAQSYALISDADTHVKMACGDPKAAFAVAILDPELTLSQPRPVAAITGYDALSHAVESFVTIRRNHLSDLFAREAWRLLEPAYLRVLEAPADVAARGSMLLGAHLAGIAIEQSMLGATHACANPLTTHYGTPHGVAIALLLPHVVRWNGSTVGDRYAKLLSEAPARGGAGERLADHLTALRDSAGLPATLSEIDVPRSDLQSLAEDASGQWTGRFNPRAFDAAAALSLYEAAY